MKDAVHVLMEGESSRGEELLLENSLQQNASFGKNESFGYGMSGYYLGPGSWSWE